MVKRFITNSNQQQQSSDSNDSNNEYGSSYNYSSSSAAGSGVATEKYQNKQISSSSSSDDNSRDSTHNNNDRFHRNDSSELYDSLARPPNITPYSMDARSRIDSDVSITPEIRARSHQSPGNDYNGYYARKENSNGNLNKYMNYDTTTPKSMRYPSVSNLRKDSSFKEVVIDSTNYDRYPIHTPIKGQNSYINLESKVFSSSKDSNSSLSDKLFESNMNSPFGGYPTSLFPLLFDEKEDDDFLHNPDPEEEARLYKKRFVYDLQHMSRRSIGGWLGILLLLCGGAVVFIVIPALTYTGFVDRGDRPRQGGSSSGGGSQNGDNEYLTAYTYPQLAAIRTTLVDPDTPSAAKTRKAKDGSSWNLVFSDEFNAEGRTFYDGDDQFWTAPDIHYDATKDLEWYSPDAVTTAQGTLKLRMDAFKNHDLYYRSGMIQSWNKLCFTQGALEVSANLPNYGKISGLWPGIWTMGNLARPGYLASTEGVWPYGYESCDAGITPNQSSYDGISYLPGQKLNICTCDDEDHPNQGTGRGAPELDILEAEADTTIGVGVASQSMQIAPFDIWYIPDYQFVEIYNFTTTTMNSYCGGPFQQAISAVTTLNTTWYEFGPDAGYYQTFSIEYLNDDESGYVRWFVGDDPTFTIYAQALHENGNIGSRTVSKEPMSIIMNLGISNNWAYIDWQSIYFPVTMSIDYVRLYQPKNQVNVNCDPTDYPTYDYIQNHLNAYQNPNLTSWEGAGYSFPKNILTGNCKSSKFKF
ncbi:hypothetical protein Kpol_176p1 [Vanderwaltozyma polyspora DSM 70294]|uniref:GH16 domain-containing protein n=1 Tax=Vanderwaltozyma polyspora (strain ATCC 22028 / DSM 70294 / BCRC 21397 / CBS 2163 / NBRC 10782 / NRRL Y-8283 / UCD 57-17) TaxID=436907 RepID=A7TTP7_VANPO|nr:uncharacterized protein Kpol_176p1 [Vanderwaltozyma polyspora DSM 70294]EDO14360.1 hypothetical protein Kpol_176p1 [Vanderwaltozyma polyspora DSM 70294]